MKPLHTRSTILNLDGSDMPKGVSFNVLANNATS